MDQLFCVICIKKVIDKQSLSRSKECFLEFNIEIRSQSFYCIYCLACVNKKFDEHNKNMLDHFIKECFFKENFKPVAKKT